ncbi:MAG: porin, partial [Planctomycetia bacterium]
MRRFVRSLDDIAPVLIATLMAVVLAVAMPSAQGEPPLVVEEIPPPAAAIEELQADIRRLEKELETLRSESAKAASARLESATKKEGDAKSSVADRLSTVEKSLGKLVDAADKKKRDDAKKPLFILSGQMQADQIYFGQDEVSRKAVGDLQDGAQFRRLRIGARGTAFEVFEYSFGVDFALASNPSYLDNYIEWKQLPWLQNVRAGHYFEPFSLERVTQNRNNTFMERSLVDTFAPARNMGIMTYGTLLDERSTYAIGTFRTNSDNTGNDTFDSGQALTMRGTWLPFWDEASEGRYYLHLGAAYSWRDASQNQVRFRNTPEIRKQQPATVLGPVPGPPPVVPGSPSNYQ